MKGQLADRWAVITHHNAGKTPAQIECLLPRLTWNFIGRWVEAAKQGRGANDKLRAGRPPKVTPAIRKKIKRNIKDKDQMSPRKIAARVGVGRETIRVTAKRLGLHPYHKRKRQLLSADHKRRRLAFARKYAKHDWHATMLTDEKIFNLFPASNSRNDVVWTDSPDSVPPRQRVSKSAGIMVWGGITYYGKTPLIRLDGKVNAAAYQSALKRMLPAANKLFGERHWCLQQDGASPHTAASTQQWLADNVPSFIPKNDWPANSPDANSIENLWGILTSKVDARRPSSVSDLWRIVKEEWRKIPLSLVQTLIDSQPKRLSTLRTPRGGYTKY